MVLVRVATLLCVLTSVTAIAAGQPQASRRWWRTARRLSGRLADRSLTASVVGQQAVLGLYSGYRPEQVLVLAGEAHAAGDRRRACVGVASAIGAQAQALSVLGRTNEAQAAVGRLRAFVDRLPTEETRTAATWLGYPRTKVEHVASYVNTRLGRTAAAAVAQDAALTLYPPASYRGRSQVELHRAACLVTDGAVDAGVEHAMTTLGGLPEELRRDVFVRDIARLVVDAVPRRALRTDGVTELRELLGVRAGGPGRW